MILRLDDGTELNLRQEQIQNFALLRSLVDLSEMQADSSVKEIEALELKGVEPMMVRDFFDLHERLARGEKCDWFCQKVQLAGNGYARDLLSLNIYLGFEAENDRLYMLLENLFKTMPDNVISHGFGL